MVVSFDLWRKQCLSQLGRNRRADLADCRRRLKRKKLVYEYMDRWFITTR
jgi:hypothetical protein